MSILTIKQTLEAVLNTNITTTAIKWSNTAVTTLNNATLTTAQVNALTMYIEAKIIPIEQQRELVSSDNGVNHKAFFQVDIYIKSGSGTGSAYILAEQLDTIFRDKKFTNVVCESVESLGSFPVEEWIVFPVRVLARTWN